MRYTRWPNAVRRQAGRLLWTTAILLLSPGKPVGERVCYIPHAAYRAAHRVKRFVVESCGMAGHHIERVNRLRTLTGIEVVIYHRHDPQDERRASAVAERTRPVPVSLRLRDLPPAPPSLRR